MHSYANVLQHINRMADKDNAAKFPNLPRQKSLNRVLGMIPSGKRLLWMHKPKKTSLDLQHPCEFWVWWLTSVCPVQGMWRQVDPWSTLSQPA